MIEIAAPIVSGLAALLRDNLLGVYLHGSLALGCFNPRRSDLDVLVVTHQPMAPAEKRAVAAFLLDISGRPYPMEISFLARDHLRAWRYPTPYDFHYSEDWRAQVAAALADGSGQAWTGHPEGDPDLAAHFTVLHARGVVLTGPPIAALFPSVPRADFLDSIRGDVLDPHFGLSEEMTFPVYSLLNACRTLAYLRTGEVLSKAEGGEWALAALPPAHHPVIAAALDAYRTGSVTEEAAFANPQVSATAAHLRGELAREFAVASAAITECGNE